MTGSPYVCGPTVYNYAHIGNARPAVIFDLLYRLLALHYPEVVYARNITDVDDKINAAAAAQGVPISEISARYAAAYHEDMAAIGAAQPTIEPRATEHIAQMIEMIRRLIDEGHAYEAEGHVLFDIGSFEGYGALSRRDAREMIAGSRVEIAPFKRNPGDFVLWKPSEEPQPGWDSPWGRGRPGWRHSARRGAGPERDPGRHEDRIPVIECDFVLSHKLSAWQPARHA